MTLAFTPAATATGWRARVHRMWVGRHRPRDQLTLTQRNVYILPTRVGLVFGLTLLVLLVASINYQLNLGYLLTFLLTGSAAISMYITHGNLRGLQLHLAEPPAVHAGTPMALALVVDTASTSWRHGLGARLDLPEHDDTWVWFDAPPLQRLEVPLRYTPSARGQHDAPVIIVHTRFPFGLFRAWSIYRPAIKLLVYPKVEYPAPPWPVHGDDGAVTPTRALSSDDTQGVRAYRRGDPWRDVVWKKSTHGMLVSRDRTQSASPRLWLVWEDAGELDFESRLSRLTAWVLQAHEQGRPFGLRLPGFTVDPDHGSEHLMLCLHVLALWPQAFSAGRKAAASEASRQPQQAAL